MELFFDLVFVFAVTQVSHALLHHPTALGALETGLLILAVWWVWVYTTWATNFLNPDHLGVRAMLFGMMFGGLVLAAAVPHAFAAGGLTFALAYVAMQLGRTAFLIWAIGPDNPPLRRNFQRILVWLSAGAVLWIAGGLAEGGARVALWGAALAVEYLSPAVAFWVPGLGRSRVEDWSVEGAHLAERFGLFVIIALGEGILITGATFASHPATPLAFAAFVTAFAGSLAMWWVYFDSGAARGEHVITGQATPGQMARLGYTYLHLPIIAGIIIGAAGDEMLLAHPSGSTSVAAAAFLLGGPAVFLLGTGAFKRLSLGWFPLSHRIGLAVLAAGVAVALALPPIAVGVTAVVALTLTAAWERRSLGRREPA